MPLLQTGTWSFYEIMKLEASRFITLIRILGTQRQILKSHPSASRIPDDGIESLGADLLTCADTCQLFALIVSETKLRDAIKLLGTIACGHLYEALSWIERDIEIELGARSVIYLDPSHSSKYESIEPLFGDEVFNNIGSAIPDISEAGTCLALKRGTACVFHLMRAMEAALKLLGRDLGIPYAPSWESYLSQITKLLSRDWKDKEPEWKSRECVYKELLGDLQAVKLAWRNPTMHIVRIYSPDEAAQVFGAVRIFVQKIAASMAE